MSAPARAKARYRELGPLAQGGMADLCCAEDDRGAQVVIKRIRPNLVFDATYRELFQGEGDLAAALDHPNIVRLLDRGEDDSGPFLVFEQVEGTDLSIVLDAHFEAQRPMELAAVFAVFIPLLKGLHAAHEATAPDGSPLSLIHRDVSPGNVLLSEDGDVKLADFGVAKSALKTDDTVAGEMKGKFAYMAPEQTRGEAIDRRADLFALGIVLWECLAGRKAFVGPTDADVVQAVREQDPPDVRELNPQVPEELAELCARLLTKDPAGRFDDAAEVASQLLEIATDLCLETGLRRHVTRLVRTHPRPQTSSKEPTHASGPKRRTQKVLQPDLGQVRQRRGPLAFGIWVAAAGVAALVVTVIIGVAERREARAASERHVVIERLPDLAPGGESSPGSALDDADLEGRLDALSEEELADDPSDPTPLTDDGPARELPSLVIGQAGADAEAEAARKGAVGSQTGSGTAKARGAGAKKTRTGRPSVRPALAKASGSKLSTAEARAAEAGFGRLYLASKPWAEVFIDGAKLGKNTPILGLRLPAGAHTILLKNPHYGFEKTFRVMVPKDGKVQRHVDLAKP